MNTQFTDYRTKALHDAKIEDLKARYIRQGFEPKHDDLSADKDFDLVVRHKDSNKIVAFEVKTAPISPKNLEHLEQMKAKAKEFGYGFRLITIHKPKPPKIEINWLENAFFEYVTNNVPDELCAITPRVFITDVEIFVNSISITEDNAEALTEGTIETKLQFGSDNDLRSDNGLETEESFPFTATLKLDLAEESIEAMEIHIDDSVYY